MEVVLADHSHIVVAGLMNLMLLKVKLRLEPSVDACSIAFTASTKHTNLLFCLPAGAFLA